MPERMSDTNGEQFEHRTTTLTKGGKLYGYKLLPEADIRARLGELAQTEVHLNGRIDSVSFQPAAWSNNADRRVSRQFDLPNGQWTFTAIFDGHAGSLVSHLASEQLPQEIEKGMRDLLQRKRGNDVYDFIPQVVQDAIETFEDGRRSELFEKMQQEFPGGEQELEMLSDEEIRTRLPDAVLVDSMAGSTAVIALVDPNMKHLWVANLGDSFATLVSANKQGNLTGRTLSEVHNTTNRNEVDRIRAEHPDSESECVVDERVLGILMLTRVLGDTLLKVPGVYANKGYRNLGWVGPQAARVQQFCPRILTPPYVSTKAFVAHVELSASDRYLILASDGLSDFFHGISLDRASRYWIEAMMTETWDGPLSLRILRHALGGDDLDSISKWLTLEHPSDTWLDDTTITVMRLGAR